MGVRSVTWVGTPQLPYYHVKSMILRLNGGMTIILGSFTPRLPDIEIVSTLLMVQGGMMRSSKAYCLSDSHLLSEEMERVLGEDLGRIIASFYKTGVRDG